MVPSIAQQLQTLRATMADTIIPALPAEAGFAQEQAGLMLATLDWLADVQAHAYRYELTENAEYRALLEALAPDDEEARAALAAPEPPQPGAVPAADAVAAENATLKALAGRLFEACAGDPAARALMVEQARRQGEREAAWFRMTGFPRDPSAIGEVLASE